VKNNNIIIVEAKVSLGKDKINTTAISNYLYKLAAVNKQFGLNAKAILITFADLSVLKPASRNNIEKRCRILNLPFPFDKDDFIVPDRLHLKLKALLN